MAAAVQPGVRSFSQMSTRTKVVIMAGTLLGLFTSAMDQTVVGTSMPRIVGDLGGFGLFSWVGTGFMLASTTTVPIVGKLTDIFGRKPFYMAGIFILLLGSALAGSSQTIEQLIAFRVVQGLGAGMIMGIAFAIIGDVFPPAERGKWAGLMSGVFASASVIGPLIGGTLTDHAHWRWVFYVNLPLGAVALSVLFFGMPNIRPAVRPRLDYRGIFLLMATVVPMLLAFSWAGSRYSWVSAEILGLLSWAAAGVVVFTYAELRTEEPLLPMSLFRSRVFTVSALVTLVTGIGMFGSLFYIPLFVQGVIGRSATNSGLVTMPMMIAMAVSSAIAGQVMSRFGRYRILGTVGLVIIVAGMYLLSTMTANSSSGDATRGMLVLGVGLGMSMPLFMLAVQNAVPYRFMGISTSTMQFLRAVGGTMGVALMFSLVQRQYSDGLQTNVPESVRSQPQFIAALKDPQFLLNQQAFARVSDAFNSFGAQGDALFQQTLQGVKVALAASIADAFFVSVFVMMAAVVIGVFMKEVPLRRVHYFDEGEPAQAGPGGALEEPAPGSAKGPAFGLAKGPALAPVAGGANGPLSAAVANGVLARTPAADPPPRSRLQYVSLALLIAASLGLLAFMLRRNGRRP
ncbi:MAG: DHA2 family efflux MFS transporter permease subunit [Chloroflexi bacterium]|nr:DHA2 family efflux MFS transporter permease subunit [Chloroflexota bacterium]